MERLRRLWYGVCQQMGWVLLSVLLGMRVYHRERLPARGGILVVANHQSYLDPIALAVAMPRRFQAMAMASLFRWRPFRWLLESLYAFPVRLDRPDLRAVKTALRRLKRGEVVLMFPEGQRTYDGRIGRFKGGAVTIAARAGVPILPMVIDGAFEAWPRTRRLPRLHPIQVACGRLIPADEVENADPETVLSAVRQEMERLLAELRDRPQAAGRPADASRGRVPVSSRLHRSRRQTRGPAVRTPSLTSVGAEATTRSRRPSALARGHRR